MPVLGMLVLGAIALFGVILLVGGSLTGHDHDVHLDHDTHSDHGHDADHGEPTVSIFSLKVIGTFLMAFGAAGAIAGYNGAGTLASSLCGLAAGVGLGGIMYGILWFMYGQQATSLIDAQSLVGQQAVVTVGIDKGSCGQVEVTLAGQRRTYLAASAGGAIPRGRTVEVVSTQGSQLTVRDPPRVAVK
jgi:membrane-bound ClpP family serine protease